MYVGYVKGFNSYLSRRTMKKLLRPEQVRSVISDRIRVEKKEKR